MRTNALAALLCCFLILSANAEETSAPKTLEELRTKKLEAARQIFEFTATWYERGLAASDAVTRAGRILLEAEREAAPNKDAELAAIKAAVKRADDGLKLAKAREAAGQVTKLDVAQAEYDLCDMEIALKKFEMSQTPQTTK